MSLARSANARNNALTDRDRRARWQGVRDSLWQVVDEHVGEGARVAIVGAGNCDDVPLARLAARASHVALVDIDTIAPTLALQRLGVDIAATCEVVERDMTCGMVDAIFRHVDDAGPAPQQPDPQSLGVYDVAIGDLLYTQLLQAAIVERGRDPDEGLCLMREYEPTLTALVVRQLHAAAELVVHVHDIAVWSPRQSQPRPIAKVMRDPHGSLSHLNLQRASDPQHALTRAGADIESTHFWHWPAGPRHDYLVRTTVARTR
jgi:hypothetical protein